MAPQRWKVVGGGDKGGLMVRSGKSNASVQLKDRLSTGAIVEEVALEGDRLNYRRLTGEGPDEGWVLVKLKDKFLVEKTEEGPAAEAATPEAPAAAEAAPAAAEAAPVAEAEEAPAPAAATDAAKEEGALTGEALKAAVKAAEDWWNHPDRKKDGSKAPDTKILTDFVNSPLECGYDPPGDYKGGQLPVMPRTRGVPTYAAVPDKMKKTFPERPSRRPMMRLYCFPGAADNYMLWIEMATKAPEWCEVAIYEPKAHGFRPDEPWDRTLEERAADAFTVMKPAFMTHAKGGVSEGAPFAFLSHGVGGQFMACFAQRLKRELGLEPLVVFANDGPPANAPTLSDVGYKGLCGDTYNFYEVFQPNTTDQMKKMGLQSKQAQDLLTKWSRGLRIFEDHSRRCVKLEDPVFHKFDCDLHVLVARHTVDHELLVYPHMPKDQQEMWDKRKPITGGSPECGANWDREAFKKWKDWTNEDFYYHELETDHMTAKNSPLMMKIVFGEMASFCGMEYTGN